MVFDFNRLNTKIEKREVAETVHAADLGIAQNLTQVSDQAGQPQSGLLNFVLGDTRKTNLLTATTEIAGGAVNGAMNMVKATGSSLTGVGSNELGANGLSVTAAAPAWDVGAIMGKAASFIAMAGGTSVGGNAPQVAANTIGLDHHFGLKAPTIGTQRSANLGIA